MKDGEVQIDFDLFATDRAVKYLLDRVQHDRNLRWYMLHTQAMALLCEAESARTGEAVEEVEQRRAVWLGEEKQQPDVVRLQEVLEWLSLELTEAAIQGSAGPATLKAWLKHLERALVG